jgi:hypothetical protein
MKLFLSCLLLLLIIRPGFVCRAERLDLPQFREIEGYTGATEEDAIQQVKRLGQNEAAIKLNPQDKAKIEKKSLELLLRWPSGWTTVDYSMMGFQTYWVKLMQQHPEWVPLILEGCARPIFQSFQPGWDERYDSDSSVFQPQYFPSIELLPFHDGCTWENSRAIYRQILEQYRTARQHLNQTNWQSHLYNLAPKIDSCDGPPGHSYSEVYLIRMLRSIPGVLARFPTAEGVEEMCQQLEAYPGYDTLAAANALSVCTSEATLPRVRKAFETAKRIRNEFFPGQGDLFQMPFEYARLQARLADVKADLSGMMEGAGFRLIKPDWSAWKDTTWNTIPPAAAVAASPAMSSKSPSSSTVAPSDSFPWWLALLLALVSLVARGYWDRRHAANV